MAQKFDDLPLGFSDNLAQEEELLSHREMEMVAEYRFQEAGAPEDKLQAWLDDHQAYPKRADVNTRVGALDTWGMRGLMRAARDWMNEKREEDNPYGADLA